MESCETNTRILERTNKYFLTVWHFVHSALAFKVLAILFSHKFIARLIHLCAVATNWKEDIASYKPFCPQQCCQGEGTREWMGERTKKKELSPITLLVFTCILVPLPACDLFGHGSLQSSSDCFKFGWEYKINNLHMIERSALDRSCDACCWTKRSRPRRTSVVGRWLGWSVVRLVRVFICLFVFLLFLTTFFRAAGCTVVPDT